MAKLNLGCGTQIVDGWVNVDYSLGARLSKLPLFTAVNKRLSLFNVQWDNRIYLHNLTSPFPWEEGSVEHCYSSHVLEHMTREDGEAFMRQAFRVLRRGGAFRVVVPDLRWFIAAYQNGSIAADHFLERLDALYGPRKSGLKKALAPFTEFPHKCMYDTETLVRLMERCGFRTAARGPFDSVIPDIRRIELAERTQDAVIVEGVKP